MSEPVCLRAALGLAAKGIKVFPFGADKRPLPGQVRAQSAATTDLDALVDAWTRWPDAALHALTGARGDGGLGLVIDVDAKDGKDGFASLRKLETMIGLPLPPTLTCRTPSGGAHLHFLWPGGVVRNTDGEIGVGLDTKGTKGQIVMPPTRKSTGVYAWEDADVPVAELPGAYAALLRPRESPRRRARKDGVTSGSAYARAVLFGEAGKVASAVNGRRRRTTNDAALRVGGVLHLGMDVGEAENVLLDAALACGLPEREARATVAAGLRDGAAAPRMVRA